LKKKFGRFRNFEKISEIVGLSGVLRNILEIFEFKKNSKFSGIFKIFYEF
jgi:hypothetical protein